MFVSIPSDHPWLLTGQPVCTALLGLFKRPKVAPTRGSVPGSAIKTMHCVARPRRAVSKEAGTPFGDQGFDVIRCVCRVVCFEPGTVLAGVCFFLVSRPGFDVRDIPPGCDFGLAALVVRGGLEAFRQLRVDQIRQSGNSCWGWVSGCSILLVSMTRPFSL